MTLTKQQVREVLDVYIQAWGGPGSRPHLLLTFDGPLMDSLREYWASEWSSCHRLPSPTSSATPTGDERHRALLHTGVLAPARSLLPAGRWRRGRRPDPLPGPARLAGRLPCPRRPPQPGRGVRGPPACNANNPQGMIRGLPAFLGLPGLAKRSRADLAAQL